jgi:lysozyme
MYIWLRVIIMTGVSLFSYCVSSQEADTYDYSRGELFSIIRTLVPGSDVFSLPRNFKFPDNTRAGSTFIVDFSHYVEEACNCEVDWNNVADAKASAVYLKATQGRNYVDPSLAANLKALAIVGRLDVGVYHFMSATDTPESQAKHFLDIVKIGEALQLPPSLDLEWDPGPMRGDCPNDAVIVIRKHNGDITRKCDRWAFVSAEGIIERVNTWLDKVETATGRKPILYTSDAWLKPRLGDDLRIKQLHADIIWIADYSKSGLATEKPAVPKGTNADLWQFTDGAAFGSGSDKIVMDASIFNGELKAMRDRLGIR